MKICIWSTQRNSSICEEQEGMNEIIWNTAEEEEEQRKKCEENCGKSIFMPSVFVLKFIFFHCTDYDFTNYLFRETTKWSK